MKLRLMTCAIVASAALFAENEYDSATYGILAVSDTTTTNTVVGVPWVNVGEGNVTLSNLVSTATLENNDVIYFYEDPTWYSYKVQDGVFVRVTTVNDSPVTPPPEADAKAFARGTGLIIQRANTANPIYLCGRYEGTPPSDTTVSAGSTVLIANPKTVEVKITSGNAGDQIQVPGNGGKMKTYMKKSDGFWYEAEGLNLGGLKVDLKLTEGVPLAAGKGALYVNKGSSAVTIAW